MTGRPTLDALWKALATCPPDALRWAALGYHTGLIDGRALVMAHIGQAGQDVIAGGLPILRHPTHAELTVRRTTVRDCRCRRCSACIRCVAVSRNRERYGTDDYPGTGPTKRPGHELPAA